MSRSLRRGGLAVVLAVAGWLVCQPGYVQAHPKLVGKWKATNPAAFGEAYEFQAGEYQGNGVWRGCYTYFVENVAVATGTYELRAFNAGEATVGFVEGPAVSTRVGNVDLLNRVLTFQNVTYHP
jgi:hypothetical protein